MMMESIRHWNIGYFIDILIINSEPLEFIRNEFKWLGNCPICGKCSFLKEREGEASKTAASGSRLSNNITS